MTSSEKKTEASLINSAQSPLPTKCHTHTKRCIIFKSWFAHTHLNLVFSLRSSIPARKGKYTCTSSKAPSIGTTVDFI